MIIQPPTRSWAHCDLDANATPTPTPRLTPSPAWNSPRPARGWSQKLIAVTALLLAVGLYFILPHLAAWSKLILPPGVALQSARIADAKTMSQIVYYDVREPTLFHQNSFTLPRLETNLSNAISGIDQLDKHIASNLSYAVKGLVRGQDLHRLGLVKNFSVSAREQARSLSAVLEAAATSAGTARRAVSDARSDIKSRQGENVSALVSQAHEHVVQSVKDQARFYWHLLAKREVVVSDRQVGSKPTVEQKWLARSDRADMQLDAIMISISGEELIYNTLELLFEGLEAETTTLISQGGGWTEGEIKALEQKFLNGIHSASSSKSPTFGTYYQGICNGNDEYCCIAKV